jgi:hypothetical protein
MTTRFRLPSSGTAPISPAFDASWEATGTPTRFPLIVDNSEHSAVASTAVATILNVPAGAVDVAIAQFVSAPLSGNQTIAGAIKGQIRALESNAAGDLDPQCVIRVLSNDGTTVRGTLIPSDTSALGHEFNNAALRNVKYPKGGSTTPTSVAALDGDRIVIEVGYRKHENATTSRTGTLSFGDNAGTDLAEDETTTTANDPWFEFADTLTFAAITARASQTVALALTQPVPDTRVSQTVALVATGALVTARVSQTVALVATGISPTRVSQTVALVAVENNPVLHGRAWAQIIG